jgi:hypothetical protein
MVHLAQRWFRFLLRNIHNRGYSAFDCDEDVRSSGWHQVGNVKDPDPAVDECQVLDESGDEFCMVCSLFSPLYSSQSVCTLTCEVLSNNSYWVVLAVMFSNVFHLSEDPYLNYFNWVKKVCQSSTRGPAQP